MIFGDLHKPGWMGKEKAEGGLGEEGRSDAVREKMEKNMGWGLPRMRNRGNKKKQRSREKIKKTVRGCRDDHYYIFGGSKIRTAMLGNWFYA